jgi:hypothetical protein
MEYMEMTVTYTTAANVASLMRLIDQNTGSRLVFSTDTDPTLVEVENLINRMEDHIDRETGHAWRAIQVMDEYYDIPYNCYNFYQRQFPIHLKHRNINTLVSGTDKIEVWTGNEWEDIILDANGYTEGRGNDYWVDYTQGIIYLKDKRPWTLDKGIRVSYRYGESSVPGDIEDACTKLVAINIAENDDYVVALPEGTDKYSIMSKVDSWKRDVERILYNRREIITI